MPWNYPKESIQHLGHGKSLKSRILHLYGEKTARDIRLLEKLRIKTFYAYKLQTPGNYPKESIQHLEHGKSLKSTIRYTFHN
jgi:hypothetical protein